MTKESLKKLITYLLLISALCTKAQHYQFSQFYAAQTYLNPAFTGANTCARLAMNYRNQWSNIPGTFTSYQVSLDKPMKNANNGIGFQLFSDKAGLGSLKTTQLNILYSYQIKLSKEIFSRAGASAGFARRSIDYSALTFGDQIGRGGAAATVDDISTSKVVYFDLHMGYLVFSKAWWAGLSFSHLNRANQSLNNQTSNLPIELKFHGGYKYLIEEDPKETKENHSVSFTANYKRQQKYNQIDIGAYYTKGYMVLGLWYRGIPLYKPFVWYTNNDALILMIGFATDKLNIGYSFDYTVSKLNISNTNGTHEVSVTYPFCSNKKKKKKRPLVISCPKF